MSQRLIDVEQSNLRLFTMLFRHQVYLEGIKASFAGNYKQLLRDLYGEFAKYVGQTQYDTLDQFTRVELQQFIRRFTLAQTRFYSQYTQQLIGLLQQFVAADVDVTNAIYEDVTGVTTAQRNKAPLPTDQPSTLGLRRTRGTDKGNAALWASIADEIIPANGMTIPQMLKSFGDASSNKVGLILTAGYANGESVKAALTSIVGDSSVSYRDGLFSTLGNQNSSLIATAIQHASSITQAAIASVHYNQYQWVAMLDSRTTEICRSRNGNVYNYGDGPLPPAHYNCRSKAVSLSNGDELHDIPSTYYAWLLSQPENVLVDMLGQAVATQILTAAPIIRDISVTDSVIPLTISQFASKIDIITA